MAMTLITTNTSSGAASSDFTSGIDSTYKLYIFEFTDVNPATDDVLFRFQANASGQSGYNEIIGASTRFGARQAEGGAYSVAMRGTLASDTAAQIISAEIGNGGDECMAGQLHLFNPSSTTYMKHFYARTNTYVSDNQSSNQFTTGYFNITAAITNVQFTMESGNMDAVIKMYGVG